LKKGITSKGRSAVCKSRLFEDFHSLCKELPSGEFPGLIFSETISYANAKLAAVSYQTAKKALIEQKFSGWLVSPQTLEAFTLSGNRPGATTNEENPKKRKRDSDV